MSVPYKTIPATTTADTQLITGQVSLVGLVVVEDAGTPAAASFVLRDGTSTSGAIVVPVKLALSSGVCYWFGDVEDGGIIFKTGIFLDMIAGSINGAIYLG